jgi:hypothetical protein
MAPMTPSRASQPGDVPNELMATYYGQRSTAGLIISEAKQISPQGKGFARLAFPMNTAPSTSKPTTIPRAVLMLLLTVLVLPLVARFSGADYDVIADTTANVLRGIVPMVGLSLIWGIFMAWRAGWLMPIFAKQPVSALPKLFWLIPAARQYPRARHCWTHAYHRHSHPRRHRLVAGEKAPNRYHSTIAMKTSLFFLLTLASLAQATPPVLSLTQASLQKVDPEIKPDHYDIARTDLNADGKEDVLALMNGRSGYTGSGGTTMFILKGTAEGFESLGSIKVVNEPIYARKSVKNGFRDLLVTVSGGGATPGLAALSFNGKKYPASPGDVGAKVEDGDKLLFAEPTPPFDQKGELQDITFQVFSPNSRSGNTLTVTPAGLEEDNRPIEMDVSGIITRIEVADINVDGSPELYVYGFDGKSQTLFAWSANNKKSLSQITLPDLDAAQSKGYRGGDEYAVVEGILGRRFPIYPDDQPESKPSAKTRQLQYKLHAGEAGWLLKVDKVVEF